MQRQDKTNNVIDLYKEISRAVDDLATCSYTTEAFTELLNQIQAAVRKAPLFRQDPAKTLGQIDRLNLEGYANLEHWVAELDKRIELILLKRLTQIIQVWCTEFDRTDDADTRRDHTREASSKRRSDKRAKDEKVCGSLDCRLVCSRFTIDGLVP
jgi:hypothetical protein